MSRRGENAIRRYKPSPLPYKKTYEFSAPEQPTCTIESNGVYHLCQSMWKNNDVEKFNRFLATMKSIRKAIMRVGSDEKPVIDTDILKELEVCNTKEQVLTGNQYTKQELPTESTLFDSSIWYYIFRAMLPRGEFQRTPEAFSILSLIFKNLLETHITATYETYKTEADVRFQKDIRSNHLKKNVRTDESKLFRVKSYAKSFGEYKTLKTKTITDCYEKIVRISAIHDMSSDTDITVQNIWKMFSLYLQFKLPPTLKEMNEAYKMT